MAQDEHEVLAEILERSKTHLAMRARIAREDVNEFCELVLKDEETGNPILQAPLHERWHSLCSGHKRLVLWSHTEAGKALVLGTPIPTPSGWTTMGDLSVGDIVFGSDGKPCSVTGATAVQHDRTLFEVGFDDGVVIRADAEHQWSACNIDDRASHRAPRVVTTDAMRANLTRGGRNMWTVPTTKAVQYPVSTLPIHPYVLGVWLGDGSTTAPEFHYHADDKEIVDRCVAIEGGKHGKFRAQAGLGRVVRIGGASLYADRRDSLQGRLEALGVLGNKHVPDEYLTASVGDRRELLAGLLDTDGTIDARGNKSIIELTFCREVLATDAVELARSLGFKVAVKASPAKIDGRVVGTRWRITFTAREPVFKLARKLAKQKLDGGRTKTRWRTVVSIRPTDSVPVKCITVDSPDSTYLIDRSYTVTHNTSQICVGRTLWLLGRNPKMRIAVISNTQAQSSKIILAVGKYIADSKELRLVFPHLKPGDLWRANAISVERPIVTRDPSLQAFGVHGAVVGARIDHLILDDVLDFENCQTPRARQDLFDWYRSTVASRLTKDATVIAIGTPWHPEDLYHRLEQNVLYSSHRFPVLSVEGGSTWLERWPLDRIEQERIERGPLEFARTMMCEARDESDARFKREYIDKALEAGDSWPVIHQLDDDIISEELAAYHESVTRLGGDSGVACYSGVDMAVQKHAAADYTAISTIMVMPNEDRRLLCVEAGRWSGPEIVDRIIDTHERYNSIVTVENNAAQDFILQFTRKDYAIPIQPFTTGRNKLHPEFGVESLAAEFANYKWVIPNEGGKLDKEIEKLITEMLYYQPDAHTGDRLMSLWLAREGARRNSRRSDGVGVRIFGKSKPKLALVK